MVAGYAFLGCDKRFHPLPQHLGQPTGGLLRFLGNTQGRPPLQNRAYRDAIYTPSLVIFKEAFTAVVVAAQRACNWAASFPLNCRVL